jgi:aminoglycoside phosphotransferase (APT) family kinase protein
MLKIDTALVRRLVDSQFPQWAGLAIKPVASGGWDNRTFHLGADLLVRLPCAECYVPQVEKEHRWLPQLAPPLPVAIPSPVGLGRPGCGYPWPWSVYRWIGGETVSAAHGFDAKALAADIAGFLLALQAIDASEGPFAGTHNFYRGGALEVYDRETRQAIATLCDDIDAVAATAVWEEALTSTWNHAPVWVHGDVAAGNLLLRDGRLCAVIDFGSSGVGDPACDLVVAWTMFDAGSRAHFKDCLSLDADSWRRARGWALWKALITVVQHRDIGGTEAQKARHVIDAVLSDQS